MADVRAHPARGVDSLPVPILITDPDDERVRDYFSLTDVHLRKLVEPASGLYMAESDKVIRRALDAGHRPRSFLMSPRWVEELTDLVGAAETDGVPVFVGEKQVIEAMTGFNLHRGVIAAMHRPSLPTPAEVLRGARRVVVLEDIVDHTNVGAIFRSAAALGVDVALVTPRCADPLYRRSVRVSMGAVLQVPWARLDSWPGGIELLKEHGYLVAGMTLGAGAITLDELVAEEHPRLALVFGTEGHGLTRGADRRLDRRVTIPMMHGVDSLNVAAASAVVFYATR